MMQAHEQEGADPHGHDDEHRHERGDRRAVPNRVLDRHE